MIHSSNIKYNNLSDLEKLKKSIPHCDSDKMLLQIFCGVADLNFIKNLLKDATTVFPKTPIIGVSTAGEIMDGQALERTVVINVTTFEHTEVHSVLVPTNDDLINTGEQLATGLNTDTLRAAIILGCGVKNGHTINASPMLKTLETKLPNVLFAGGQAGDNGVGEITYAFTETGITTSGVAAAALSGDHLSVNNTYNLSWVPIGKKMTITKAEGSRVYSIDNMPPYEIYKHYLGQEVADGLPLSAADFPLIIERDNMVQAIHASGVNDDGSFDFIHNFHVGEQMRFGYCHAGLLAIGANKTYHTLKDKTIEATFVYSCVSRKWVLGTDISVELSPIADLGCSAGFFSYGEYFHNHTGEVLFLGQTMTVLTLAETDDIQKSPAIQIRDIDMETKETRKFRTLRVLHRLVETSAKEIETMNLKLSDLAHKDSLTNLHNRRHFDEQLRTEMRHHKRNNMPLSIILLDIDQFKRFNDTYGHVAGDDCLRGIGQALQKIIERPEDVVARYGGEEFAVILPKCSQTQALQVAEALRASIEALNIPHMASSVAGHVTASLGVLTVRVNDNMTRDELVEACDELLYDAKDSGRNRIVGSTL